VSITLGTRLSGRYRLEARIAAGGMSTVYKAIDETLERTVAIKLMNREVASDSDQLERFRREARAVAQLSHPHIVTVIDAGDDADPTHTRPYIVFEYVEGETLKDLIRREGRLPVPEALAYAIEIARALGAAHARHIVHRDVKPQNVLIDRDGSAKVTDFGIARTLEEDGLTADGRVLGTTDYVSPEQALGRPVTGRSDLYSLGIVLFEMLTGDVPFHGDNQVAVAMKHVREEIPDVALLRPGISAALAQVVDTATAKSESERYADAREMIADLEDALGLETARAGTTRTGEMPAARQATTVLRTLPPTTQRGMPLRTRPRRWIALAAVAVTTAIAVAVVFLVRNTHSTHPPAAQHHRTAKVTHHRVAICSSCAHDYNPDALPGSAKTQNPQLVGDAIDGNRATAWQTEIYYDRVLGKQGVGLYVRVPAVAARTAIIDTTTPGYSVSIYGSRATPNLDAFVSGPGGWTKVGSSADVHSTQRIPLDTHGVRYRYYLLWITSLGGREQVRVGEFALST
jgi:tRNA A-37 threonylcarbamoyl transferase component Bud32